METITTISDLRERLDAERGAGRGVGFVPTMGYLHAGHLSLASASVADNPVTVVSIFVNPLQFAEGEDLDSYPRDLVSDSAQCAALGVDYLFVPSVEEMYPSPIVTVVEVPSVATPLEGLTRPHHFAGVATVVAKLFSIVGKCRAYLGAKDWQQVCVVERMVSDLSMPVEVVACPTVREPDGLAMSSRNVYLTSEERVQAPVLRAALDAGLDAIAGGETDSAVVEATMAAVVNTAGLASLDYAAAVQADSLVSDGPLHGEVRLLVAARFGKARLIDNDGTEI
ncbi:MAG: pantoate--beta-alanine ligase [Acidimicrobiaceae bacterium]|nr:pantoate--beta-alanine ligase [Acidimicrobiaceae bacterium]